MPCDEMRDRLSPYLEGELSESERKALEAHLGECADCAALLAVLRESVASLRAAPEADPPPHLARRIQEAVAQKAAEQSRPRTAWGWTWMPAFAAAASFLVMIGLIAYLDRSAKAPVMIAAKVEQETPRPAPVPASAPPPARAMEPEKVAALAKEGEKAATPETRVRKDSLSAGRLLAGRAEDVEQKTEVSRADERLEAARPRPAERSYPAAKQEFAKIAPRAASAPSPASREPGVVITLSQSAARAKAFSIVTSLGGVPSELREEAKAKKEVGATALAPPQEIEKFSFPFGQYDRLIAELRALDPDLAVSGPAPAGESEVRLIIRTKPREP
jgi:hypothetical protein